MQVHDDACLTYCMNVHPGESLAEVEAALEAHTCAVKARVSPDAPFGVGLWLSEAAVAELQEASSFASFAAKLDAQGLFAFTLNAFPMRAFHEASVKRRVYRPTWADAARYRYTLRAAELLAALLPEGRPGTISTLPLSFKAFDDDDRRPEMLEHLGQMADALARLERRTGHVITLALEPEPGATLETTDEVIAFFERELRPSAARLLRLRGHTTAASEELLRRHIGVCFDTCHVACAFEDPCASIARLQAAGVAIAKAQISVAIELREPATNAAGVAALRSFVEPRYLHQTRSAPSGLYAEDLPALFDERGGLTGDWSSEERLRTHFHVPIYWRGDDVLGSTRGTLDGVVPALLASGTRHFEVETYTWAVLPDGLAAQFEREPAALLARELEEGLSLFAATRPR